MWTKEDTPERLTTLLVALGRSQRQLAAILNTHPVTVSRWKSGKVAPDPRAQEKLTLLEKKFVLSQIKEEE